MQFVNSRYEHEELTYEDVFLFQDYFEGNSRLEAQVAPSINIGTTLPIIIANMNAVSGKRMAETIARYGGVAILPQDMHIDTMVRIITYIKSVNIQYDTPITVKKDDTIRDALGIINKRAHNCVILVDDQYKAIDIFKPSDFENLDQFTLLGDIKKGHLITGIEGISDEDAFMIMDENNISSLPIVDANGILKGILTKKNTLRNSLYKPALDNNKFLNVGVALGIHGADEKIKILYELGVRLFVLDTAHGYQKSMIENIKRVREIYGKDIVIVAGNVVTQDATKALLQAGADGVKVGIGPGAMCTTRMKTGVGRPQFTAVYKCSLEAQKHGGFVWADGGIKEPRDFILALAAGATHVMMGTIFAGTFEAVGDIKYDEAGNMYKENYGMASKKAVTDRSVGLSKFAQAQKQMFREGISSSRIYMKPSMESVGDIVDEYITGLRSAMTYIGAKTLQDFSQKALIGVQTSAAFVEGTPHGRVRK